VSFDDLLPDANQLYEHLLSELNFLRDFESGAFERNCDNVTAAYFDMKGQESSDWTLNLSPNWVLDIGGEDFDTGEARDFDENMGKAIIGGKIAVSDGDFEEYSLNLTLLAQEDTEARGRDTNRHLGAPCCWSADAAEFDYRVARRYHFDIDMGDNKHERKPVSHLQNGGEFDTEHLQYANPHYCSSPLDKPRLPHPPMDPILILHMLAKQYQSLSQMIQSEWGNRVRRAERNLWQPYHSTISDWYEVRSGSETFASYVEND
jgi:hypothetical protein